MKAIHLALGAVWIAVMIAFIIGYDGAWWGMFLCAIAGLWYLPFGTLMSVIQLALLMMPALRNPTT